MKTKALQFKTWYDVPGELHWQKKKLEPKLRILEKRLKIN